MNKMKNETDNENVVQELSRKSPEQNVNKHSKPQGKRNEGISTFGNIISASMLIAGVIAWQVGILFDVAWLNEWMVPIVFSSVVYLAIPERVKEGNWFYAVFIFSLVMSVAFGNTYQVSHFYTLLAAELIVERVSTRMRRRKSK